jgi:N-formylglutamate amidohydrolase
MKGYGGSMTKPLFISIPHSGEEIPQGADWLKKLPEVLLMYDVDRYVDQLYGPAISKLHLPSIKTQWHRYAADLNRIPEDIDSDSVIGSTNPKGTFTRGFHWSKTTEGEILMPSPMSMELHQQLIELIYTPFHVGIKKLYGDFKSQGFENIYHLDCHSMPSVGTKAHNDPGEVRADIVVSDQKGKSCDMRFKNLVIEAYQKAGFKVAYNWPYYGGRVTQEYGQPNSGQHTIQIEMSRAQYMDEKTKKLKQELVPQVQDRLQHALSYILENL